MEPTSEFLAGMMAVLVPLGGVLVWVLRYAKRFLEARVAELEKGPNVEVVRGDEITRKINGDVKHAVAEALPGLVEPVVRDVVSDVISKHEEFLAQRDRFRESQHQFLLSKIRTLELQISELR